MASPTRNIALRYLESIESPQRAPLKPTLKYNETTLPSKNEDLDRLAQEIAASSPTKTALLRSRFENPLVTVSAFKTPTRSLGSNRSLRGLDDFGSKRLKQDDVSDKPSKTSITINKPNLEPDDTPAWARSNFRDNLRSPNKSPVMKTPAKPTTSTNTQSKASMNSPSSKVGLSSRTGALPFLSTPANSGATSSAGYEYLCRIEAVKQWLEQVLEQKIEHLAAELITYIRNGIHLAQLANVILPTKRTVFSNDSKLQFKHTENINRFFQLLDFMNMPDLFRFELTDLYDAKNVPKVWFCLHAMSYMLSKMYKNFPKVANLVGQLDFEENDIRIANRALVGTGLPNFASADTGPTAEDQPSSSFMDKLLREQNDGREAKLDRPETKRDWQEKKPRVFVESAIQTENPFHERKQREDMVGRESVTARETQTEDIRTQRERERDREFKDFSLSTSYTEGYVSPYKEFRASRARRLGLNTDISANALTASKDLEFTPHDLHHGSPRKIETVYPDVDIHTLHVIKLQALARGANFRYRMFVDKIMLKSFSDELSELFAVARGNLSRSKTVHRNRGELRVFSSNIVELQALARGKLLRCSHGDVDEAMTVKLQSLVRGWVVRRTKRDALLKLGEASHNVTALQAIARRNAVYRNTKVVLENYDWMMHLKLKRFQAACRTHLFLRTMQSHSTGEDKLVRLQAKIRGARTRLRIARVDRQVLYSMPELVELQLIARGGISRLKLCNNVLVTLLYEDSVLNTLYAKVRGDQVRENIWRTRQLLKMQPVQASVLKLQSVFRGVLLRFERDIKLEDTYNEVDHIIDFQSVARGALIRNRINDMYNYYEQHMLQVVRAQAIIRAVLLQQAYRSLIVYPNPPLSVVARFAHLLTDNDRDYREQMEVANLKDRIVEISKQNEDLEGQLDNLDIKLSLLDKNKITVEEFIKNRNKYKTYRPAVTLVNVKNIERLDRSLRDRIELYQSMFYFLQTRPEYLSRMYDGMEKVDSEQTSFQKKLLALVSSLFPIHDSLIKHHLREEYYFVKLILALMHTDMAHAHTVSDITKQHCFWVDYFMHLNNLTYQRQHLKSLVGGVVSMVVENDEFDFESDPLVIYDTLREQEIKVEGFSEREVEVPAEVAIKDPDVSTRFVENLMSLREMTTELMSVLGQNIARIPLHVRVMCREAFDLSRETFPEKLEQQHFAVAGVIFVKHYVSMILHAPENYGFLVKDPFNATLYNNRAKDNLRNLGRVMLQLFSMKSFSDNFLRPLNEYVQLSVEATRELIAEIIDVGTLDTEYDLNDYNDIITHERPKLTMAVSDMILLEKIVNENIDIIAPLADDQLFMVNSQLYSLVQNADDFMSMADLGTVTLNLSPSTKEESLADAKVDLMMTQAKRCILYIMRIQDARKGLLELLISAIKPEHETKYRAMVESESKESGLDEKRRPYYRAPLGDLTAMSFHELKKMCLLIILELESMGLLTRKNSFQELLNRIAVDIKTKDTQRESRRQQLEIAQKTVDKLSEKERFLKKQLLDYNKHIESVLLALQSKPKDRKIFNIIPVFSKQYFYHRELRKRNRLPKFGSYKYSTKKLMDQGVLVDFGGIMNKAALSSSKLDFMFSCHNIGKFTIEAANGNVNIPGACNLITLDQLLSYQYENKEKVELFDGMVTFDTHNLTGLIFRKFYDLKKE